jgi:hypothetical protein
VLLRQPLGQPPGRREVARREQRFRATERRRLLQGEQRRRD